MPKPQLHISAINTIGRCGEQFRRRHVEGEIIPPAIAMVVGLGTDRSVTANLGNKIETGKLLKLPEVLDVARDSVNEEWEHGIWLGPDEKGVADATLRGAAVDKAVRLSGLHAQQRAPALAPTHVQRSWVIELPNHPLNLAGTIDIQEGKLAVIDTKTSKKSPSKGAADDSDQLTLYALAAKVLDGVAPLRVILDYLVDLKTGPKVRTIISTRTNEDFQVMLRRVENAAQVIEAGVFPPARQDDWWCGPKWCGYWATCPYARRRVTG